MSNHARQPIDSDCILFCCYCGRRLTKKTVTIEHLIPKSKGGNESQNNKKPCCSPCNNWRGAKSLLAWKREIVKVMPFIKIGNYDLLDNKYNYSDLEAMLVNIDYTIEHIKRFNTKLSRFARIKNVPI